MAATDRPQTGGVTFNNYGKVGNQAAQQEFHLSCDVQLMAYEDVGYYGPD